MNCRKWFDNFWVGYFVALAVTCVFDWIPGGDKGPTWYGTAIILAFVPIALFISYTDRKAKLNKENSGRADQESDQVEATDPLAKG